MLCFVQRDTRLLLSDHPAGQCHVDPHLYDICPFSASLVGAGTGPDCRVCCRRQCDTLFVHSFGLRAHNEAEEVLVWYGGPTGWRRGRGTALIIQTRSL